MARGEHGGVVDDTNPESNDAESERAEPKNRGFDRARNSENRRTNPALVTWQEMRNLLYIMIFDQKYKTNWDLKRGRILRNEPELDPVRSTVPRDHVRRREPCWNGLPGFGRSRIAHTTCVTSLWARMGAEYARRLVLDVMP